VNGDILISATATSGIFGNKFLSPASDTNFLSYEGDGNDNNLLLSYRNTGALGVQTSTTNWYEDFPVTSGGLAMQTLAFKPSTSILIADAILPDAAATVAYSAQLHGMGGTAGLTYACTGLPANGLSLNTSTGVISGATPTLGVLSLGCTVTDGSITSATDTLTLTIQAAFQTPTITATNFVWSGDSGSGATFNIGSVACGSMIVLIGRGDDTHTTQGWVQAATGANNFALDSFNSPVKLYQGPIPGMPAFPLEVYILGPTTHSGTDTINLFDNQSASSARVTNGAFVITGVQSPVDVGSQTNIITAASGTTTASYTSLVPNTLLLAVTTTDRGANAITIAAPFTTLVTDSDAQGYSVYADALIASPSTTTLSSPYTVTSASAAISSLIIPLRPAATYTGACNAFTGFGEKIRRLIY